MRKGQEGDLQIHKALSSAQSTRPCDSRSRYSWIRHASGLCIHAGRMSSDALALQQTCTGVCSAPISLILDSSTWAIRPGLTRISCPLPVMSDDRSGGSVSIDPNGSSVNSFITQPSDLFTPADHASASRADNIRTGICRFMFPWLACLTADIQCVPLLSLLLSILLSAAVPHATIAQRRVSMRNSKSPAAPTCRTSSVRQGNPGQYSAS